MMLIIYITLVLGGVSSASVSEFKSYENYKIFELHGEPKALKKFIDDVEEFDQHIVTSATRKGLQALVAPEILQQFSNAVTNNRLKSEKKIDDFSKLLLEEERRKLTYTENFSWTSYYDIDDIFSYLHNLSKSHPDAAEVVVGGQSFEGRDILGLKINTPVARAKGEDKPIIFIESGIHAREWITPAAITYFINELFTNEDPTIQALRDNYEWQIFPSTNPDGYHFSFTTDRMWRKTRSKPSGVIGVCSGADPNRNWGHNWMQHGSSKNPCRETFGGTRVFSETETKTLSKYVSQLENLQAYVAFHSDAQMLLLPYSDSAEHCDNYDDLVKIGRTSLEYGYRVNGEKYDGPATAAEILYKASGGSMDWVREALGTPLVFTYELRGQYFHWPAARISEQGDEVTQMLLGLVTEAENLGYL